MLDSYLSTLPRGQVAAFAGAIGISGVYLSQLRARQDGREPSPELCVRIEVLSGRCVMRWDLRPGDWHLIWPELIDRDLAPVVETQQEARDAA